MMQKKRSVIITALLLAALFISSGLLRHFGRDENHLFEAYTDHLFCQEVAGIPRLLESNTLPYPSEPIPLTPTPYALPLKMRYLLFVPTTADACPKKTV